MKRFRLQTKVGLSSHRVPGHAHLITASRWPWLLSCTWIFFFSCVISMSILWALLVTCCRSGLISTALATDSCRHTYILLETANNSLQQSQH